MDIRSIGWAQVPSSPALARAEDGRLCVDPGSSWGNPPADPSSLLSDFLAIRPGDNMGEDVLAFVRLHGVLNVCRQHQVTRTTPGHRGCEPLRLEPLDLWEEHVERVASLLWRWGRLEEGEEPFDLTDVDGVFRRDAIGLERRRRAFLAGGVREDVVRAYMDGAHSAIAGFEPWRVAFRKEEAQLARLARTLGPEDYRRALASDLDEALGKHQPVMGVVVGESGSLARVLDVYGVLPRLYFDLAAAMASERTTFFCSVCDGPYQPKRMPKRGQANYCPRCRAAGAARRLSNRRRRAAGAGESG